MDADGTPYPVARTVEWLAEATGTTVWEPVEPTPGDLWVAGAHTPDGLVLLAANLAATPVRLDVTAPGAAPWLVRLGPSSADRRDAGLRFDHHESEGGGDRALWCPAVAFGMIRSGGDGRSGAGGVLHAQRFE